MLQIATLREDDQIDVQALNGRVTACLNVCLEKFQILNLVDARMGLTR